MGSRFLIAPLVIASLLLGACSNKPMPDETYLPGSCCSALNQLPFYQIATPKFKETFEIAPDTAPVYQFQTGLSPFQAVQLPAHSGTVSLRISSIIENQVFVPYFLVLNSRFEVIQSGQASVDDLRYGTVIKRIYVDTELELDTTPHNPDAARYLIMYTAQSEIGKFTEFKSSERIRAEEEGLAPPIAADPKVPHGYYGSVQLDINPLTFGAVTAEQLSTNQPVVAAPVVAEQPVASPVAATPVVAEEAISPARRSEAESFYNQLIERYVAEGDIAKALTLVEEAESIGSKTARDTFIEAVKGN